MKKEMSIKKTGKILPSSNEERMKRSISHGGKGAFICIENNKLYYTQNEAATDLNLHAGHIGLVLNNKRKHTGRLSFYVFKTITVSL